MFDNLIIADSLQKTKTVVIHPATLEMEDF